MSGKGALCLFSEWVVTSLYSNMANFYMTAEALELRHRVQVLRWQMRYSIIFQNTLQISVCIKSTARTVSLISSNVAHVIWNTWRLLLYHEKSLWTRYIYTKWNRNFRVTWNYGLATNHSTDKWQVFEEEYSQGIWVYSNIK